mmetsp:Transcript_34558/g.89591  ORF Transcript_34558/g.89591 Transcript_34558/m.89591 type:complete len:128 (+) Transcript_34558:1902-2285(+)
MKLYKKDGTIQGTGAYILASTTQIVSGNDLYSHIFATAEPLPYLQSLKSAQHASAATSAKLTVPLLLSLQLVHLRSSSFSSTYSARSPRQSEKTGRSGSKLTARSEKRKEEKGGFECMVEWPLHVRD